MLEFVKTNNQIVPKPTGLDFTLESGVVYDLLWDDWQDKLYLHETNPLQVPSKVYHSDSDEMFITRVLNNFHNTNAATTGVLLEGLKGSGKTMMAKIIAQKSNLPIVVVNQKVYAQHLLKFFSSFTQPVCILFDELEKNNRYWNVNDMLSFLDGVQSTCRKIVLMTCNSSTDLTEFIKERCSRVRYSKMFYTMSNEVVTSIVKDLCGKEKPELAKFIIDNVKTRSFDNILCFVNEHLQYPDISLDELAKDMNLNLNEDE